MLFSTTRVAEAQNKWVRANRVWHRQARTNPDVQWEREILTYSTKLLSDIAEEPTWPLTAGLSRRPGNLVSTVWQPEEPETHLIFTSAAKCSSPVFVQGEFGYFSWSAFRHSSQNYISEDWGPAQTLFTILTYAITECFLLTVPPRLGWGLVQSKLETPRGI